MKIKEYDTNELLMIANNVTGEYPEKKVRHAKEELYRRGVDDKVIADIMEEKEEAFMRRLDAAALAEQARLDKKREKNRKYTMTIAQFLQENQVEVKNPKMNPFAPQADTDARKQCCC